LFARTAPQLAAASELGDNRAAEYRAKRAKIHEVLDVIARGRSGIEHFGFRQGNRTVELRGPEIDDYKPRSMSGAGRPRPSARPCSAPC
jgi:hypothetical protein